MTCSGQPTTLPSFSPRRRRSIDAITERGRGRNGQKQEGSFVAKSAPQDDANGKRRAIFVLRGGAIIERGRGCNRERQEGSFVAKGAPQDDANGKSGTLFLDAVQLIRPVFD